MLSVFITGGCGFIGSWLARLMLQEGHDVILFDLNTESGLVDDIRDEVELIRGSITDAEKIREVIKIHKPDAIVHYAALLSAAAEKNPKEGYNVNIASTWNIFKTAIENYVGCIVFASSIAAYGPTGGRIVSENDYILPSTLYGVSKIYGEVLGTWLRRRYGIGFAALRYASVIGPGRRDGGASAYTTLAIQKPAQGEEYNIPVPRDARVPIVYVKDAVDATYHVIKNFDKLGDYTVFNVAGPQPTPTAEELTNAVRENIPEAKLSFKTSEEIAKIVRSWPSDVDTSRIRSTGWIPKYSNLRKLISDFVKEVRSKPSIFRI